jgi:uncharacterized protein HemY
LHRKGAAVPVARYHQALAAVYLQWLQALEATSRRETPARWTALEGLLLHAPGNAAVLGRLLTATREPGGVPPEQRRQWLQSLLKDKKAPVLTRVVLAFDCLRLGQRADGLAHLREALRMAPPIAQAVNNVAVLLAQTAPGEASRALALMDAVLERWPKQAHYRETRGQILAKLGRWAAARDDLEAALPGLKHPAGTHRTLAEVYEHLGQPTPAAAHRRQAGGPGE